MREVPLYRLDGQGVIFAYRRDGADARTTLPGALARERETEG